MIHVNLSLSVSERNTQEMVGISQSFFSILLSVFKKKLYMLCIYISFYLFPNFFINFTYHYFNGQKQSTSPIIKWSFKFRYIEINSFRNKSTLRYFSALITAECNFFIYFEFCFKKKSFSVLDSTPN